jgi:hypothetical protein
MRFQRACRSSSLVALFMATAAHAGPPFRTDDPEPVEYQHWELYNFSTGAHIAGDTMGSAPAFDFNYGAAPNLQLHINPSTAFDATPGSKPRFGVGDTEIGAKYRFLEEDKGGATPMAAIFPLVELPTGSQPGGLGAGYLRAFLPLWLEKNFGDWTTYGGGGYWLNASARFGDRNFWYAGWTLQRKLTAHLTLGTELFYQTAGSVQLPTNLPSPANLGFNIGAVYDVDEHNHLLFSAGRGLLHATQTNLFSWYAAWQLTY